MNKIVYIHIFADEQIFVYVQSDPAKNENVVLESSIFVYFSLLELENMARRTPFFLNTRYSARLVRLRGVPTIFELRDLVASSILYSTALKTGMLVPVCSPRICTSHKHLYPYDFNYISI